MTALPLTAEQIGRMTRGAVERCLDSYLSDILVVYCEASADKRSLSEDQRVKLYEVARAAVSIEDLTARMHDADVELAASDLNVRLKQ